MEGSCTVRPLAQEEIPLVINYFLMSDKSYLKSLGTDVDKLPSSEEWQAFMLAEFKKPLREKKYFCLGWFYNGDLIGHSCIDSIEFGDRARAHLHIWKPEVRHKNLGKTFFLLSLKYFF